MHFLSRGDFKPSNESVQTENVKEANELYRRPDKQYERDSSMTKEVHDTISMLLVFLNFKK